MFLLRWGGGGGCCCFRSSVDGFFSEENAKMYAEKLMNIIYTIKEIFGAIYNLHVKEYQFLA